MPTPPNYETRGLCNEFITEMKPSGRYRLHRDRKLAIAWILAPQLANTDNASGMLTSHNTLETLRDSVYPLKLLARVIR